jgi:hypothetical protein
MALQRVETDAIEDDAITTDKIAANAVAAADIAVDAITNAKVAAGASIAVSKISGLGTAATLTAGTSANNVVQLDGSGNIPAVNGSAVTNLASANLTGALPAIDGSNLTGITTDTSAMENNIAILAFKTQSANNLAKFNLIDQVIDEYKDGTGVTLTTTGQVGSTAADGYLASVYTVSGAYTADANTLLLLHMEDATFSDSSTSDTKANPTISGSVTRSSTQAKFGTYSALIGGASNASDYLSFADHVDWDATTGYTIDYWLYVTGLPASHNSVVSRYVTSSGNPWSNYMYSNGKMCIGLTGVSELTTSTSVVPTGSWHHWAIVKNGGSDTKIYKDGVQVASGSGQFNSHTNPLLIGGGGANGSSLNGYIDEVRISDIARWTSGFTPNSDTTATSATGTAISTANTALTAPTTGDICMLIENYAGTATLNTTGNDLRCAISRNGGTGWDYVTLVDKGSWGTNKKILTANNVAFSNSASGTDMRYKIEWANQASGTKETRVHATSLAWA